MSKEYYLPCWAIMLAIIIGVFSFITLVGVISIVIGCLCGFKCYKWAEEIGSNTTWAFFVGYLFGLIGLFFYWIFYNNRRIDNLSKVKGGKRR